MNDEYEVTFDSKSFVVKLLVLAIFVGIVWVWRPLFHMVIYRMAYSPFVIILFGGSGLVALVLYLSPKFDRDGQKSAEKKMQILGSVFALLLLIAMLYGFAAGLAEDKTIAKETMAGGEELQSFPEYNADNPRIVPRKVADKQTRGSVSYRQYQLGESDIARMENGNLSWSYAVQPDPFRVMAFGHQQGVFLSDMTRMDGGQMRAVDNTEFKHGRAMLFHRSAEWNVKKTGYWSQYRDEPVEFVHNGTPYMAYPKTGHEWRLSPIPHTVPTWDGVALVHPDGTIEHLSPEEARNSEILEGQRLYPIYNSKVRINSLGYRNGILNQMPIVGSYEGVVETADLPPGAGNEQPFVVDLKGERMAYVMALEPHGRNTRGLDEVWFADSRTGEFRYYSTNEDTLLGPERAVGKVRSADSQTQWDTKDTKGQFKVVEPIPVVIDGELWWHAKVVPTDYTDVSRNVMVNAHTGETVALTSTEEVVQFMEGDKEVGEKMSEAEKQEADAEGVAYYLVIKNEDGEVIDRIAVSEGETVEVVQNSSEG